MKNEYKKLEKIMIEIDVLQLEKQIAKLKNVDCKDIERCSICHSKEEGTPTAHFEIP